MILPDEQVVGITVLDASTPIKNFWAASIVQEPLNYAPRVVYAHDVSVSNDVVVDGYIELKSVRTTHRTEDSSILQPQSGHTLLRTSLDTPVFSAVTSTEKTVFAGHVVLKSTPEQHATQSFELFSNNNRSIRVEFYYDAIVAIIFGVGYPGVLPTEVIAVNDQYNFETHKFLLVIDTKLLGIPPVLAGTISSYLVSVRILYNNIEYVIATSTVMGDPLMRFVFEAQQGTLS